MSRGALRAAAAVFLLGMLVVWLVRPIGNPCPDVGKLPSGSTSSSSPSFTPPLTRTCTYMTPDATKARRRYVPVVDLLVLALIAGLLGGAIELLGPARRAPQAAQPRRAGSPPGAREEHAERPG